MELNTKSIAHQQPKIVRTKVMLGRFQLLAFLSLTCPPTKAKNPRVLHMMMCVVLMFLPIGLSYAEVIPRTLSYAHDKNELVINGAGFGSQCSKCEVIGQYAGLKYSLPISSWSAKRIRVRIPPLGSNVSEVTIRTANDVVTMPKLIKYKADLIPPNVLGKLVRQRDHPSLIVKEYQSKSNLGDKGIHTYDISHRPPACGVMGARYARAEIVTGKRTRFARTAIVQNPAAPCFTCKPIKVKYFVEPTGHLHYQLHVYRERIEGICPKRVRN